MRPVTFGVVADEIGPDLERACRVAVELGMQVIEINDYRGTPIDRLETSEIEAVRDTIGSHGLRVDAVGTLALKALELSKNPDLATSAEFAEQLDTIRRAARVARALAPVSLEPAVRIFSFRREPMEGLGNPSPILPDGGGIGAETLDRIVAGLQRVCDVAREEGVALLVENVRSCWGNTGVNLARILALTDRPELKIIWDVANDWVSCGQPYREGYLATRPWTACVHVKDAKLVDPTIGLTAWMPIGQGAVDVEGQASDLLPDGFAGPIILETHWRGAGLSKEESSRRSFAGLTGAFDRAQAATRGQAGEPGRLSC